MSRFLLLLSALLGSAAMAAPASRDYRLSGFDRVALGGSDRVIVDVGPRFGVRATGEPADLARMRIFVDQGTLRIGREQGVFRASRPVTVAVTLPRLAGAAVAGSGVLSAANVQTDTLAVAVGGSGAIRATGRARRLSLKVGGSGRIDARALDSRTLSASVAGSGAIRATARESAAISVSGSGTVRVAGTTRCQIATSGSGSASCG